MREMSAAFEGYAGTGVDAAAGREEWRSAGSRLADDVARVRSGRDLRLLDLLELAWELDPDPAFDELDDQVLVAEAGRQAARIAAATCRYVQLVAELVVRGVWADHGARTPAQWLSFEHGMGSSTAAEHIRVGLRLRQLPLIRERFAAGELSYSKVRAITRVAVPELESMLVQWCQWATGAEIEELVTGFRRSCRATADEQVPDRQRSWSRHSNGDGTSRFVIRMPDDEAAAFEAGLERLLELEDADSAEDVPTVAPGGSASTDAEASRASSDVEDSRASADAETSRASFDGEGSRAWADVEDSRASSDGEDARAASRAHGRGATASSAEDASASDEDAGEAERGQQLLALNAPDGTAFVPPESHGLADADRAPQQHGQRTRAAAWSTRSRRPSRRRWPTVGRTPAGWTATRSCCRPMARSSATMVPRRCPSATLVAAGWRCRPGCCAGWPARPAWRSSRPTTRAVRSTWVGGNASPRPPSGAPCSLATVDAGFRAVGPSGTSTHITSSTGPMRDRPIWTISCFCAPSTTASSMTITGG